MDQFYRWKSTYRFQSPEKKSQRKKSAGRTQQLEIWEGVTSPSKSVEKSQRVNSATGFVRAVKHTILVEGNINHSLDTLDKVERLGNVSEECRTKKATHHSENSDSDVLVFEHGVVEETVFLDEDLMEGEDDSEKTTGDERSKNLGTLPRSSLSTPDETEK